MSASSPNPDTTNNHCSINPLNTQLRKHADLFVYAVGREHAAGAAGSVGIIDQVLCRCESIQQGIAFILKSFIPAVHITDFSSSEYSFCQALCVSVVYLHYYL